MKVALIAPSTRLRWKSWFASYSLACVAGATPPDIEVEIIDENVQKIDYGLDADLVGITTMTHTARRAYQIAKEFRERGVKVVLGGIHASAMPREAAQHADAVVIGEAEDIWPILLMNFAEGRLQQYYQNLQKPNLRGLPMPRWDLINKKKHWWPGKILQTTRGCSYDCFFCSVTSFFGKKIRCRPIEDVIREIETLIAMGTRLILFFDDNITANRNHAKKLFQAIIEAKLGIKWAGQAPLQLANDRDLLQLAAKSGCMLLFAGLETLSKDTTLSKLKPFASEEKMLEATKIIHGHGISIFGAWMLGFDPDDQSVFERTLEFAHRANFDACQFTCVTPLPGTRLFNQLEAEGRILTWDWSHYDFLQPVFRPKLMTAGELQAGVKLCWREFYSPRKIAKRIRGGFNGPFLAGLALNLGFWKGVQQGTL